MIGRKAREAIKSSWSKIHPVKDSAVGLFYMRLFELRPELRPLFKDDLASQKGKLVDTLTFVVNALDYTRRDYQDESATEPTEPGGPEDLRRIAMELGYRHRVEYRVPDDAYPAVAESLVWAIKEWLGDRITDEEERAWIELVGVLSDYMILGAEVGPKRISGEVVYDSLVPPKDGQR